LPSKNNGNDYAINLCDTILLTPQSAEILTLAVHKKYEDVCYQLEDLPAPATASKPQTNKPKPSASVDTGRRTRGVQLQTHD
jgi:hypothetical protein